MFDAIAPRYDLVNRVMTFRLDVRWRRLAVRSLELSPGAVVADLASGTGDLCVELAGQHLRPISVDLSFGMLHADRSGAPRAQADILRLPFPDAALDGATCGFALRNLVDLGAFFDELGRVVRPGGRIALLDVATPPNPLLRWGHRIYFGRVVPRDRWAPVRSGRLPVPAPKRGVPPAAGRDAGPAPVGRLHHRAAPAAVRWHHPARHGDAGMTA